jgi:hypothetical protein
MSILKPQGALGAAAILGLSALAAVAQEGPAPAPPAETLPMTKPEPSPQKRPAVPPSQTPAGTPAGQDLVGLSVFSSDGTRVGDVRSVTTGPSGNITALYVKTGGFLGFGGRIVAIPGGRFGRSGKNIRLTLSAEQVDKLPEVTDKK